MGGRWLQGQSSRLECPVFAVGSLVRLAGDRCRAWFRERGRGRERERERERECVCGDAFGPFPALVVAVVVSFRDHRVSFVAGT